MVDGWREPLGRLVQRLEASFRGGHRCGVVQFAVEDDEGLSFHAHVGDTVSFAPGRHALPAASVTLDAAALRRLADGGAAALDQGARLSGDRGLLALLAQAAEGERCEGLVRLAALEKVIARQRPYARSVARRDAIGTGELLRALRAGQPLILCDQLRSGDWRASMDDLAARYGHLEIVGLDADILGASVDIKTVGELFRLSNGANTPVYSGGCALPGPMHDGFPLPLLPKACFTRPQLWMGRRGHDACTRLHRDFLHAFIGHAHGIKSFTLYAPDEAPLLYPGACFNMFQLALYDCFAPDPARFPLAERAQPIEIDLHPGELLVLPAGWFHAVRSKDLVLSVNRFMREDAWATLAARLDEADSARNPA